VKAVEWREVNIMPIYHSSGITPGVTREINNLKRDARRWKIIAIVLFFIGVGVVRLLSILL